MIKEFLFFLVLNFHTDFRNSPCVCVLCIVRVLGNVLINMDQYIFQNPQQMISILITYINKILVFIGKQKDVDV